MSVRPRPSLSLGSTNSPDTNSAGFCVSCLYFGCCFGCCGLCGSRNTWCAPDVDQDENGFELLVANYHSLNEEEEKRGFECGGRKYLQKRKHRIMAVGAVCIMITLLTSVVLIFGIIPSVLHSVMKGADVTFEHVLITDPGADYFTLHADGLIEANTYGLTATLDSMLIEVEYNGNILGTAKMPQLTVSAVTPFSLTNLFHVYYPDVFNAFTHDLIFQSSVLWRLTAKAVITPKLFGFSTMSFSNIDFDKTVSLGGCNGLKSVELLVFVLNHSTASTIYADSVVKLNNPSIFEIRPLGNLKFNVMYLDSIVAKLFASNVSLLRGDNLISMKGPITNSNQYVVNELINRYLTAQNVDLVAEAPANVSSIILFNEGMRGLQLPVTLIGKDLHIIRSIEFPSLSLIPQSDSMTVRLLASSIIIINNPLGIEAPLSMVWAKMKLNASSNGKVMASMYTEELSVSSLGNGVFQVEIDSIMNLEGNGEGFDNFVKDFMNLDSVNLQLSGAADLMSNFSLGLVPIFNMPVNNIVLIPSMGGLKNISILSFNMKSDIEPLGNGIVLSSQISIFNPSIGTISLKKATFDVEYSGISLGMLSVNEVVLSPGVNNYVALGVLIPSFLSSSNANVFRSPLDIASIFFSNYLNNINQKVTTCGIGADSSSPTWLNDAIKTINVTVDFPGISLQLVSNLNILSMDVSFQNNLPFGVVKFSFNLNVPSFWESSLLVLSLEKLAASIVFQNTVIGTISDFNVLVNHDLSKQIVTVTTSKTRISVSSKALFQDFITQTLTNSSVRFELRGLGWPKISTGAGELILSEIPTAGTIVLAGLNNFLDNLKVLSTNVLAGEFNTLSLSMQVQLTNPSKVSMELDSIQFELWSPDSPPIFYGVATMTSFALPSGVSTITASGKFHIGTENDTQHLAEKFLGQFLTCYPGVAPLLPIVLKGSTNGINIPLMQPALSNFVNSMNMPTNPTCLVKSFRCKMSLGGVFGTTIPTQGTIVNTFNVEWWLLKTDCVVKTSDGLVIGEWINDLSNNPIHVPSSSTIQTSFLNVEVTSKSWEFYKTVYYALTGQQATMSITGTLTVKIGDGFIASIPFSAFDIATTVCILSC